MNKSSEDEAEVSFTGLILAFSSAALSYLGHEVSEGRKAKVNLDLAKQNIDFVKLLKTKTKGNLTEDENRLLDQILTDLTSQYSLAANSK